MWNRCIECYTFVCVCQLKHKKFKKITFFNIFTIDKMLETCEFTQHFVFQLTNVYSNFSVLVLLTYVYVSVDICMLFAKPTKTLLDILLKKKLYFSNLIKCNMCCYNTRSSHTLTSSCTHLANWKQFDKHTLNITCFGIH